MKEKGVAMMPHKKKKCTPVIILIKGQEKVFTLAKYLAGFSAHLKIVRRPCSKYPDVSLFTA